MEEHGSASLHDALLVVVRQRRLIGAVYAAILATAVASIFVLAPQYQASSKVLITSNRAQLSTSSERPSELIRTGLVGDAEVNSQLEILRSRDLIETVVRDLDGETSRDEGAAGVIGVARKVLAAPIAVVGSVRRWFHRAQDGADTALYWQVEKIRNAVEGTAVKNSNVIEIAFTGPDPAWARKFVDRLTAAYVDRQAKMQRETEAESFFTTQSDILRQKLGDSEAALHALREQTGALAGQQAEVHQRLNEFNAELARTKVARGEQEQQVAYLEREERDHHTGRAATPELLQLEAKRADLLGRYRPDSERVRDIDEQIQRLRAAVASYGAGAGDAARGGSANLTGARAGLFALKGKEEALVKERDEYHKQAEMLDAQDFELVRLERQVKLDEEAYLSYVRTAEQARLSNALEGAKMLRLSVVEPASLPLEPVSPKKMRILLFALLGGFAASVAVGLGRDYLDSTVKSAEDVRRHAKLEVLAVLPKRTGTT